MMIIQSQPAVRPLQRTANGWAATHMSRTQESSSTNRPITREIQGLLNKLSWSNFDSICAVLVTKLDCSEKADDGRILREVVRMILEQVTLRGDWAEMYAKLCKKLIDQMSPELKSDTRPPDSDRDQWHTGRWFRHYLARAWTQERYYPRHISYEIGTDKKDGHPTKKADIPGDDLHLIAARIRRRRLSLFRFIGELFKVNFITETQMHLCIKDLLRTSQISQENIEYLRDLMINFGKLLDQPQAQSFMDLYFETINKMSQSPNIGSRARFMIQDIIDARKNKWAKRKGATDNSLGVHPTRSTPTESKRQNLDNPSASTQITCQKEEEDDKSKIEAMAQKEIFAVWTPTHIWTDEQQKALLEAILDQQQLEFQSVNGNLSSQGWTVVTGKMKTKFATEFHFKWLKNQLDRIHKTYLDIKFLKNRFGFQWDEKNWILSADPNTWDHLIKENPKKKYPQLRNRRDPISWYGVAQQVFNGAPTTSAQKSHFSFLNNNKHKRESSSQAALGAPLIPSPSASDSTKAPLVHKRNNETISADDEHHIPSKKKQPRLAHRDPANINSSSMSKLVLDSAPKSPPLQPTPAINHGKSRLSNPPVEADTRLTRITSCATGRENGMVCVDGRVDEDQHMAGSSRSSASSQTRPQPENASQATAEDPQIHAEAQVMRETAATVATNQTDTPPSKIEQDHIKPPSNPSIEAITLLAPMFIDALDPLQFVRFVHVLENPADAAVFLALASTTNPIICKTWLLQKSL
ncbi:hypothetical protein PGTUg99_003310 [Puccinia graminis f. sp. tritici]|uniref:MIF4G domain-containing protein n=1 Tax=Puccinia graminis f. sp. tritici TaxID=56615 RepID=A0A5B0QYB7_PUCGR|nr:hypothetical protein PGTUg99_003310 [Puccinia graminis f. sp. tritici]